MNNIKTILLVGKTGHGKSTLANVITRENKFGESAGSTSETKKVQVENFNHEGVNYRIIDTVGIDDTGMKLGEVLRKLALMGYSVRDGLSQILFITNSELAGGARFTYDLLKEVVFDKNVTKHTTVIRTEFTGFRNENGEVDEEREKIIDNRSLMGLVNDEERIIFVDNPSIDINIIDDEELVNLNKGRREESRRRVLEHLKSVCLDNHSYQPINLVRLSKGIEEYMTEKEELKKGEKIGIFNKTRKWKRNRFLNENITKKMIEHIGKIDPTLKKRVKEELNSLNKESSFFTWRWWQIGNHDTKNNQEKEIIKREIFNIIYELEKGISEEIEPDIVLNKKVSNPSNSEAKQTVKYTYKKTKVRTWNNSAGVEISLNASLKTGVPFFAEGKIELSAKGSYSYQQGVSKIEETTIESTEEVSVSANSTSEIIVTAKKIRMEVPFKYTERITYIDGRVETIVRSGTYRSMESYDVNVELKTEKISEQTLCTEINKLQKEEKKLESKEKSDLLQKQVSQIQILPKK